MKTLLTLTLLLLTFSIQAAAQSNHTADEIALRDAVKQLENGWNIHSGASFAKPFAEDADYVVINGRYIKSRAVIEKAHQQIFDTIYKDTTISLTVKEIRFLRADVAVIHVAGTRNGPGTGETHDAMITLTLTKENDGWKIATFQNTAVAAN